MRISTLIARRHFTSCLLLFFFLFITGYAHGQYVFRPLVDAVLLKAKQVSMYTGKVNWDSLGNVVHAKARPATSLKELKPAFEALLNGLGDKHGKVINAKDYSSIAWFTDYESLHHPDQRPRDTETWNQVNDRSQQFSYRILFNDIGYLKIVGIAPNVDIESESRKIREALKELAGKNIRKWIVDLRYNGGGNMYPMMQGIGPLLGDGMVGKLINMQQDTLFSWYIRNGNFQYDVPDVVTLPNEPVFKSLQPVAVLTSRWTVSSGELVATAFKGRALTKFFGEATGSFASNTGWEIIKNEVILTISTGIFCDRNGISYPINIPVDVEIPFTIIADPARDECIISAKDWLLKTGD